MTRSSLKFLSLDLLLVILFSLAFSFWLMFRTFSYDANVHAIQIAFKLWSDFGAHVPLIRSFSMGDNLTRFLAGTVQYPIFPGEPIRYHYLFFMFVGILERLGLRIDWALNVPSALGFAGVLVLLYLIAKRLFCSKTVGFLAILFFLFNGSLGFIRFFSLHPLSINSLTDIIHAKDFPAFAPWGPGLVSAFWNLNIYTNQRHLAPAFAIVLLFIYMIIRDTQRPAKEQFLLAIPWGIVFGLFPYFHPPSLLILAICMICYFFLYPRSRIFLFDVGLITLLIALPQMYRIQSEVKTIEWYPGYIFHNELLNLKSIPNMIWYMVVFWWQNLGLHSILILIGFFLINKNARRALIPIIPIFLVPNFLKFSVEASANHKFFNFVMMLGAMISGYVLVSMLCRAWRQKHLIVKLLVTCLFTGIILFLILSGIIDFFVIVNDIKGNVSDIPANAEATWIAKNTPPGAVFLNSSYLYHPASIAGRAIYLGWPYFAWSAGYQENRAGNMNKMYEGRDSRVVCPLFAHYHISYITVVDVNKDPNLPRIDLAYFLKTYKPVYLSADHKFAIFVASQLCH